MGPLVPPAKGDKQQRVARDATGASERAFFISGCFGASKFEDVPMSKSNPKPSTIEAAPPSDRLLSRAEVLEIIGVTYPTLWWWVRKETSRLRVRLASRRAREDGSAGSNPKFSLGSCRGRSDFRRARSSRRSRELMTNKKSLGPGTGDAEAPKVSNEDDQRNLLIPNATEGPAPHSRYAEVGQSSNRSKRSGRNVFRSMRPSGGHSRSESTKKS